MTLIELKQEITLLKDKVLTAQAKYALGYAEIKLNGNILDKTERDNDICPVVLNCVRLAMSSDVKFFNGVGSNEEQRKTLLKLNSLLRELENFFKQEYGYGEY